MKSQAIKQGKIKKSFKKCLYFQYRPLLEEGKSHFAEPVLFAFSTCHGAAKTEIRPFFSKKFSCYFGLCIKCRLIFYYKGAFDAPLRPRPGGVRLFQSIILQE